MQTDRKDDIIKKRVWILKYGNYIVDRSIYEEIISHRMQWSVRKSN